MNPAPRSARRLARSKSLPRLLTLITVTFVVVQRLWSASHHQGAFCFPAIVVEDPADIDYAGRFAGRARRNENELNMLGAFVYLVLASATIDDFSKRWRRLSILGQDNAAARRCHRRWVQMVRMHRAEVQWY